MISSAQRLLVGKLLRSKQGCEIIASLTTITHKPITSFFKRYNSNVARKVSFYNYARSTKEAAGIVVCFSSDLLTLTKGKSTLFNALTATQAAEAASNSILICTFDQIISPNVAKVSVPDPRLEVLAKIESSLKVTRVQSEFVDIAGLVRGASKGEGLGNRFLANIREVSVLLHLVRCFEDEEIIHVDDSVDPMRDIDTINMELLLSDLESLQKMKDRKEKKNKDQDVHAVELMNRVLKALDNGQTAANLEITEHEWSIFRTWKLITAKPYMYICNVKPEETEGNKYTKLVEERAKAEGVPCLVISAKVEAEIANIKDGDLTQEQLLELGGLKESGLSRIIRESRKLLGLHTFYTAGPMETRAWSIPKHTISKDAAGYVHSDMAKGYICAEVIHYDDYVKCGGAAQAKAEGKLKIQGADYVVNDGDIMVFKFKNR